MAVYWIWMLERMERRKIQNKLVITVSFGFNKVLDCFIIVLYCNLLDYDILLYIGISINFD